MMAAILASAFVVTGGSTSAREIKSIMHRKVEPTTLPEPLPDKSGESYNKAELKLQRKAEKRLRDDDVVNIHCANLFRN